MTESTRAARTSRPSAEAFMADLVRVDGSFACPYCHFASGPLRIWWGEVPRQYQVGDEISWRRQGGAVVAPYTRSWSDQSWNAGDPTLEHVLVRDVYEFDQRIPPSCPR